jgi:hypothetical protein
MATSLPYLVSNKNVPTLFEKISSAKPPDTFSTNFMYKTLGLKGSTDRPMIPVLRALGVLDASNKPTKRYHIIRNKAKARAELAEAIREAYRPLFDADEAAHTKSGADLKGLIAQVAGTDEDATDRIAYTFNALVKLADFNAPQVDSDDEPIGTEVKSSEPAPPSVGVPAKLRSEFHYNIQVHSPANATEETYLNIFNALRRVFQ